MKINKLEIENVKRVKAIRLQPAETGLTIIGGDNNQGKTSVLDAIAWALGGDRYRPSNAARVGSVIPPYLSITLSNGLVVERKGKNSDLKVTDPSGQKAGQQLLDSFIEKLALDLPKFMEASNTDKARILLRIIGMEDKLLQLEKDERELYQERLYIGRIADQKAKFAKEQPYYPDAPEDILSASELIAQQQAILAKNGENQRKRAQRDMYERQLIDAQRDYEAAKARLVEAQREAEIARKSAAELKDESTAELEQNIAEIEDINRKVRANLDKDKAEADARAVAGQYDHLTAQIDKIRSEKMALLETSKLPLAGLGIADGELLYKGQKWDNMSGSDRLKVATAIVRCLNPECGFVLIDKLEQMDLTTLKEFGEWLEKEGLQAIATRVSRGDECSIIIQDGEVFSPMEKSEISDPWGKGGF